MEDTELSMFRSSGPLWLFPGALHDAVGAHSTVFMTLSDPGSSLWPPVMAGKAKLC